ncbi:ArsR/SmtB family transcription factor [Gulosibacter molinativorax]|uniref:ArsR family transcriptional regulator n=1 Tax=Gulosibacter molinativorax TaxID=256821 RepID=A0ABT7CC61_9MICO|nr:metalloregulator ArsR/SmtB family transcription factor [Gulosibacter molinativorax]MDJ1372774.1 ArsR family transcriptional regulator [Gulosibacter molinativorax]QUY63373.1 ArsR family transcriptional regulator [Gulosibacter molinativorax]
MSTFAWPGFPDAAPLGAEDARDLAARIHALADPHRLRILSLISAKDAVPMTTSEVVGELGLSQSTVSHHLKQLVAAGFLTVERSGTWSMYRVDADALAAVAALLAPRG